MLNPLSAFRWRSAPRIKKAYSAGDNQKLNDLLMQILLTHIIILFLTGRRRRGRWRETGQWPSITVISSRWATLWLINTVQSMCGTWPTQEKQTERSRARYWKLSNRGSLWQHWQIAVMEGPTLQESSNLFPWLTSDSSSGVGQYSCWVDLFPVKVSKLEIHREAEMVSAVIHLGGF